MIYLKFPEYYLMNRRAIDVIFVKICNFGTIIPSIWHFHNPKRVLIIQMRRVPEFYWNNIADIWCASMNHITWSYKWLIFERNETIIPVLCHFLVMQMSHPQVCWHRKVQLFFIYVLLTPQACLSLSSVGMQSSCQVHGALSIQYGN